MAQQEITLYEKLGGETAITAVVDYFYNELVLKDDKVKHYFSNTDMEKQIRHQTKFISFALGGPKQYTGKSMEKAHEGMDIQPDEFAAIAGHLSAALRHFSVEEAVIEKAISKVATLQDAVVGK